ETTTPVASDGPLFTAVSVNVTGACICHGPADTSLVMDRSASIARSPFSLMLFVWLKSTPWIYVGDIVIHLADTFCFKKRIGGRYIYIRIRCIDIGIIIRP